MTRNTVKIITLVLANLLAIYLWIIGGPSLSFFDLSEHIEIYKGMHGCFIIYLALNTDIKRYAIDYLLPFLCLLVLMYDMHNHRFMHNIFTAMFIIATLFTITFNTKKSLKQKNKWIITSIAVIGFIAGYIFKLYSVLIAELIVLFIVTAAKLKEQALKYEL